MSVDDGYSFELVDQFGFECTGTAMAVNRADEIVFTQCENGVTKFLGSWALFHHAKLVDEQLVGKVTSDRYLFTWIGERQ